MHKWQNEQYKRLQGQTKHMYESCCSQKKLYVKQLWKSEIANA